MVAIALNPQTHRWLNALGVVVLVVDDNGRIVFANERARAMVGLEREIDGSTLGAWFEHRGIPLAWPLVLRDGGRRGDLDCHWTVDASRVRLHVEALEHGSSTSYVVSVLPSAQERGRTLEQQREQSRLERLASMGTMVAGFAHEVLNPVASMRALAESLQDELVELGYNYPHIGRMLKVLERMERLVRTSLQFGRPTPPRCSRHRPWTILSHALEAVAPRVHTSGHEIRVEVEPELPDLYADESQLTQVLVILLNNALDATADPRQVLLRARSGDDAKLGRCVRLEVSDEGSGIPATLRDQIFDPFFTTKASGTGLGLAIAQQLVHENGGRLELGGRHGEPTTFTVFSPIWCAEE